MKKFVALNYLIVLTAIFAVSAGCGGPSRQEGGETQKPLEGSLSENVETVLKGQYGDPCEKDLAAHQRELATALDAKSAEVEKLAATYFENSHWKVVPMGKSFARELRQPFVAHQGWLIEDRDTWDELYQYFLKIKDQPVDKKWVSLSSQVRGILADDVGRVVYGDQYFLGHEDEAPLRSLSDAVGSCAGQKTCVSPVISDGDRDYIKSRELILSKYKEIDLAQSAEEKHLAVKNFEKYIDHCLSRFKFIKNVSVKQISKNQWELPLDGNEFQDALAQIAGYIESVWKTDSGRQVRVRWVNQTELAGTFKLVGMDGAGGRSYVSWSKESVNLYPYVRNRSVAHEIGHVLGFKDHYYTQWSKEKCRYVDQAFEADLMSDSETGNVTDDEWKQLEQHYSL